MLTLHICTLHMNLTYMLRLNSHYNKYLAFRVKDAGEGESVFIINIV